MMKNKGTGLMMVIFLMLIGALLSLVIFSIISRSLYMSRDRYYSNYAYSLTWAGKEWFLRKLKEDNNWNDEVSIYGERLDRGEFDIIVNEARPNYIVFSVEGHIQNEANEQVTSQMDVKAYKLPRECLFSVFWQKEGPGTRLTLSTQGTNIYGHFASVGSLRINSGAQVKDGIVFYQKGKVVDGNGIYYSEEVESNWGMPILDTQKLDERISEYNSVLSKVNSNNSTPQTGTIVLKGETLIFRDFITTGNLTIKGYGRIIAKRDMSLHTTSQSQSLTILPEGGSIELIAGRNTTIGKSTNNNIYIGSNTIIYCAGSYGASNRFLIYGDSTKVESSTFLSQRRLIINSGVEFSGGILYVASNNQRTNNSLVINGPNTNIQGLIISKGRADPSLTINSASIRGLVYQYVNDNEGSTYIYGNSLIYGSVLARQFYQSILGPAEIHNSVSDVIDVLPEGFGNYVTTDIYSFDLE